MAYADFVTALMALFIVLSMMNSGDRVKASGAGCFRDPRGFTRNPGTGPSGSGEGCEVQRDKVGDVRRQIEQVRGFADHRPFNEKVPEDPRNRRVSVVVRFS